MMRRKRRKASVLGLGPVGLATAWLLLRRGAEVHAHDVDRALCGRLRAGRFPRAEELTEDLRAHLGRNLFVHSRLPDVPPTDSAVVCVGTPPSENGFDLSQIFLALEGARAPHLILRSTLIPGTIERRLLPFLQRARRGFELSYFPEFFREKFLREDCLRPPLRAAAHSSARARSAFSRLFPGTVVLGDFPAAETLKLISNAFHALKVAFANEAGDVCEKAGTSPSALMEIFCMDDKLNISKRYLRPGAAFRGPCLDKDLHALEWFLRRHRLDAGLLGAIRASNDRRKRRGNKNA